MKNVFNFSFIIFFSFLVSCNKNWYDIKSEKSLTVPSTLVDFEMLLDNVGRISSGSPGLGEVASDGHYTTDNVWMSMSDIPVYIVQKNTYTWTKSFPNTEVRDWNYPYSVVFTCNLVLEGLEKIERVESNRMQYDNIKGNALFHRARAFYELSQIFTPPFNPLNDSPYGLPFKFSSSLSEKVTRKSVYDTFLFIEADFMAASKLLPVKQIPLTRGSKIACYGFLARICLITGKYAEVLKYVDRILQESNDLLDFNSISPSVTNLGLFNKEVIFHCNMSPLHFTYIQRFCLIEPSIVDAYDVNDLRKTIYFRNSTAGISFKGMYNSNPTQFAGIATDEVYLMKAEANVRTGNINEGMKVLNGFLESRYRRNVDGSSTLPKYSAATEEQAIRIIISERQKELLLRGIRWMDLRRLNLDMRFADTLHRTINGLSYTLLPNSMKYALPIPDDEISISGITQNPGWE